MTLEKEKIGDRILIAVSSSNAALDLANVVAHQLPDPQTTQITLMHYLMPVYWEHGGADSPKSESERLRIEANIDRDEALQEKKEERIFEKVKTIFEDAGVPANQINLSERWDAADAAYAVLDELNQGKYSTVVAGKHHRTFYERLFGTSMADFLQKHAQGVNVWIIPQL